MDLEKVVYFAAYIITNVDEEARMHTVEQIEREFKAKKKEIEEKYETLIGKTRPPCSQKATGKDSDLAAAEIDAEITRLKDAWAKKSTDWKASATRPGANLNPSKNMQIIS